jgi:hypothetical protein
MSRYNSHSNVTTAVLDTIISREASDREGIAQNQSLCRTMASRLAAPYGDLEQTLLPLCKENNAVAEETDVRAFLQEQRARIKKLAKGNVERERKLQIFLETLRTLKEQALNEANTDPSTDDEPMQVVDYKEKIETLMEQTRVEHQNTQLPMHQEAYYREILAELGEKEPVLVKKDGGDDDDIEFLNHQSSSEKSLKCPITMVLLEEPVKNKTCKHVYSKAGIMQLMGQKGFCKCPVPGCGNHQVTLVQLEKDLQKDMLVRRARRRQAADSEQQASQAEMQDSDEEEQEAAL